MTIYYIKQDNTVWGCGESGCCGEYYEEIDESFVNCSCEVEVNADHLQSCNGGGEVLEWREAKSLEVQAWSDGKHEGWSEGAEWGQRYAQDKIAELIKGKYACNLWHGEIDCAFCNIMDLIKWKTGQ